MYSLKGVRKFFDRQGTPVRALDGIDLVIQKGEFVAIQGPTGQGKTTLLTLLGGMDRPSEGQVLFDGRDLAVMGEDALAGLRSTTFGFVFQTFNLIPTLSALENVEMALVPQQMDRAERRKRSEEILADLGLGDRMAHVPAELSGGQQQRVAIARALVKEPKVLLADEPTGNLDENTRDEIVGLLKDLWRDKGLTLIVVTHDSWVARQAERILVIERGRLRDQEHARRTAGSAQ